MTAGWLWDYWSEKKVTISPNSRNIIESATGTSIGLPNDLYHSQKNKTIRLLKTDLWNEVKKDETFFIGRKEDKCGIDISRNICNLAKSRYPTSLLYKEI